ncbi:hypothetical protein [Streptomyces sp. NPDC005012]|uniref:hypothetical protein n=1 Tax=Streptomyces sp. NPDC005012 TaxID=3154558 RepID=UPI0033A7CEF4
MAITDHHDVFVGATDDGYTFALLNRPLRAGPRILTDAGFIAHGHGGRTTYLLAPSTAQEAHTRAGDALADLLEHTLDIVDLAWTTRWHPAGRPAPDVRFRFSHSAMTATAETSNGQSLLEAEGFILSADQITYQPPSGMDERALVNTVVRAESHAHAKGLTTRINLGIPTPADIPAAPRRGSRSSTRPSPPSTPTPQRPAR